jgi:hypothetical protein
MGVVAAAADGCTWAGPQVVPLCTAVADCVEKQFKFMLSLEKREKLVNYWQWNYSAPVGTLGKKQAILLD